MKHIFSIVFILMLLLSLVTSVFSYDIDGIDNGYEWDGATVYKIFDGESNSGVDFGVLKYKFDYETSAVLFCFMFSDPELEPDNTNAGVLLTVEGSDYEIFASDGTKSLNINPYSFDGAIHLDENNGATAEIRVGVKSGLPESMDCCVRFIDSNGYYSNYYSFVVINNAYQETEKVVIYPSDKYITERYTEKTRKLTTEKKTTKRTTTEKTTYLRTTKPTTQKVRTTKPEESTSVTVISKTTKPFTTAENKVTIIYHEKEIYISHVYIQPTESTTSTTSATSATSETESSATDILTEIVPDTSDITLSQGTKYKKILTAVGLSAFIILACFGIYSAKKNSGNNMEE